MTIAAIFCDVNLTPIAQWVEAIRDWGLSMRSASKPETTLKLREYQMNRFAKGHIETGPWDVTLDDLTIWLAGFDWAPETRRSYRSTLRVFFHWAHITGRITVDPAGLLPPITPPITESRPTPEIFFREALRKAPQRVVLMVELAGFAGMRRGEIAIAHTSDVEPDIEGWSILVHGKGRRQRRVPLLPDLARELRAMPTGYLFPGQIDGHLSPHYVGKLISSVLPDGWAAHSLRHRFSNKFYEGERDMRAAQTVLGHASIATTQRYIRASNPAIRRGVGNVA